ncbi:endo-1,4-beta-xylanase [Arcicella aquatica]|uniref:Beta-xylanase n=1 Tax=Arcicella aquatica TaxID=217141 RepID=A0ABU5QLE2_9BACT|nr:endo-1,4-beta-xylanase [Arcicella aquatica]MEA5257877.1 endo-1,4-beta-xylanase [Arcicella aquatica]
MKKTLLTVLYTCSSLCLFAQSEKVKGLKDYYQAYFPIGVAVNPRMVNEGAESSFIVQQFSSLTPENSMKMGPIHPQENVYNWEASDKMVAFAQQNGLKVRGHNLCWHNQTPAWFFKKDNRVVTKEELLARLKAHIFEVVKHYQGKIYVWDVVNEAVPDTGLSMYRKSKFYEIIGEEYIAKAFEYAHEADPNALLFYNDYNTESKAKREKIYQLLKGLKQKGVPIHGVGLQAHWSIDEPTQSELEESITKFASLGLKIQITELDISVYPKEHERRERRENDGVGIFTDEMEQKQIQQYKMVFDVFRKHKQNITSVTFWNLSDQYSWLDNFPVTGRKDFPLLFDKNLKPKKAFWEVVKF